MSLINEALRKARQAASEHDAKQAEDVFRPRKAYPSRRSGGGGWLLTALIAVAAAVIGASVVWWLFGDRQTESTEAMIGGAQPQAAEPAVATPIPSPTALPVQTEIDTVEAPVVEAPSLRPAQPVDHSPEIQAGNELSVVEPPPEETTAAGPATAPGERVFVMEAEIGGVSLSLGYIVARSTNPFAEINGSDVYVGSEIEGFVVESIEADRVVLRDDDGPLILRVP